MTPTHKKIDFSALRRHDNLSSASSTNLSPTIPVLESPVTYLSLTTPTLIPDAVISQEVQMTKGPARPSVFIEEKDEDDATSSDLIRGVATGATSRHIAHRSMEEQTPARAKSQYFDGVFTTRPSHMSPKDRIGRTSAIVVELKVTSMIHDVESLAAAVASRIGKIYQKPDTSMMVNIQPGACLRFGTSPFPAYSMKVFALPHLIANFTNLRNTTFIQTVLQDLLDIPANRGIILFFPVPEENFATNGMTLLGEIARLEHQAHDGRTGILKTLSRSLSRRLKSTSASSTGISETTSSSWTHGTDDQAPGLEREQYSRSSAASKSEGIMPAMKYRGFRHFLSLSGSDSQGSNGESH